MPGNGYTLIFSHGLLEPLNWPWPPPIKLCFHCFQGGVTLSDVFLQIFSPFQSKYWKYIITQILQNGEKLTFLICHVIFKTAINSMVHKVKIIVLWTLLQEKTGTLSKARNSEDSILQIISAACKDFLL